MLTQKVANLPVDNRNEHSSVRNAYLLQSGKILVNLDVISKNHRDEVPRSNLRSVIVNTSKQNKFQSIMFSQCNLEIREVKELSIGSYWPFIDGPIDDKYMFYEAPVWDNRQVGPVGTLCSSTKQFVYRDSTASAEFFVPDLKEPKVVYKFVFQHPSLETSNEANVLAKAIFLFPLAAVADIATSPFQVIYVIYSLGAGGFN